MENKFRNNLAFLKDMIFPESASAEEKIEAKEQTAGTTGYSTEFVKKNEEIMTNSLLYTHIAASYAYAGEAGFTGCNYNDLVNAGVIAYINYLFGQEEPPKGELSFSSTKLNAVRDGNIQKTPNITLSGDHRNYVTLSVPENVTAHNLSKGTSVTNGKIQIYGGDTFYLSADLLLTGSYASGSLYGSVGSITACQ